MRALPALAIALLLAGCGADGRSSGGAGACTEIGCAPGVAVALGDLAEVDGVRVEVCIRGGGACATEPAAGQDPLFVTLELPEGSTVDLRVRARVRGEGIVGEVSGAVPVRTTRPNGEGCPPTCRSARVEL